MVKKCIEKIKSLQKGSRYELKSDPPAVWRGTRCQLCAATGGEKEGRAAAEDGGGKSAAACRDYHCHSLNTLITPVRKYDVRLQLGGLVPSSDCWLG